MTIREDISYNDIHTPRQKIIGINAYLYIYFMFFKTPLSFASVPANTVDPVILVTIATFVFHESNSTNVC